MSDEQRLVTEFHRAFSIPIEHVPCVPDEATRALRMHLLQQEYDALHKAFAQQDIAVVAQALAELLYVAYGTAIACGLDMAPIFREIHRSNMTKVGVRQRADGTWLRPAGYSPPRLEPLLAFLAQRHGAPATEVPAYVSGRPAVPPRAASGGEIIPRSPLVPSEAPTRPPAIEGMQPPQGTMASGAEGYASATLPLQGQVHDRRLPEHPTLQCPLCTHNFIRRSRRIGLTERLLSWAFLYPFRCAVCYHRFRAFQFRAHSLSHVVERRQYIRLPVQLPATFIYTAQLSEQHQGQGAVIDLSPRGCSLRTTSDLPLATVMTLAFQIAPDTPDIVVETALVRRIHSTGVGVAFLRFQASEQERFTQYLEQLLGQPHVTKTEDESS